MTMQTTQMTLPLPTTRSAFAHALSELETIDLAEMNTRAALQTRQDRKYLVPVEMATELVDWAGTGPGGTRPARVLDAAGAVQSPYDSVYFDTEDFTAYRLGATGHRHRYKVRTRHYRDTGDRFLEVKTKSASGQTVKHRMPWDDEFAVHGSGLDFIQNYLPNPSTRAQPLVPVLATSYRRTTLLLPDLPARVTLDRQLCFTRLEVGTDTGSSNNTYTAVEQPSLHVQGRVVIETKSAGHPTVVDRWLWRRGARPVSLSKYCAGQALLHPELPRHRWHRTLKRDFPVVAA